MPSIRMTTSVLLPIPGSCRKLSCIARRSQQGYGNKRLAEAFRSYAGFEPRASARANGCWCSSVGHLAERTDVGCVGALHHEFVRLGRRHGAIGKASIVQLLQKRTASLGREAKDGGRAKICDGLLFVGERLAQQQDEESVVVGR